MKLEVVHTALENLKQFTGFQFILNERGPLDGVLEFTVGGKKYTFIVEVKREVRSYQLQQMEDNFHHHENFLLVANHIFPKIKEELRQKGIPYLETNGNIFLKKETCSCL